MNMKRKAKSTGKKGKRNPRDTVNYTLYGLFGEPVYYGITNNLDRRLREHERDGKAFYNYSSSSKRTRTRADREETRSIHQYQDENFFSVAPRYNISKTKRKSSGNNYFDMDFGGRLF